MNDLDLVHFTQIGAKELGRARQELHTLISNLQDRIENRESPSPEVKDATDALKNDFKQKLQTINLDGIVDITQLARLFNRLREVSQTLALLELADRQRLAVNPQASLEQIAGLDKLIQSCYLPVSSLTLPIRIAVQPDAILAVFVEDQFLARSRSPVPYIIVPAFLRKLPWAWIGVAHEAGHHIYRQIRMLRDELDIIVAQALGSPGLPHTVQRLWFHHLEEVFCDLYGLLIMGAAYVHAQQALFLYASAPRKHRHDSVSETRRQEGLIASLLKGKGTTHPAPVVRGRMGIYAYERLRDDGLPDSHPLKIWDTNVVEPLKEIGISDPTGQPGAKLKYADVERGMETIVDTVLDTPLRSFNCRRLAGIVDFAQDEEIRNTLLEAFAKGEELKDEEDARTYLKSHLQRELSEIEVMRYWIAALRLNF